MGTSPNNIWCVIPVYNNGATVTDVVRRCRAQMEQVLVVDDGSTDLPLGFYEMLEGMGVRYLIHGRNRGKGAAILTALAFLEREKADYMITIDADGQHYPEDLPAFLELLERQEDLLVVGCRKFEGNHVPGGSRFGRAFANFWLKVETGASCGDCQSGFRAYPVAALAKLRFRCRHYNFETEVLTRCIWGGLKLREVPVRVHYPAREERVSHFRPWLDNLRISLIHAHLVGLRLLPWNAKRIAKAKPEKGPGWGVLLHPAAFLKQLLRENATPGGLAAAAAVGTFLAVLPLPGVHTLAILYVTVRLNLNKIMALAIQNLFMPPLTPFLCIELGYYLRHGHWWMELTFDSVVREMPYRLWEWLLGSLVLAPVFAAAAFVAVFAAARLLAGRRGDE